MWHRANIAVSNDKDKIQEDNHLKKLLSLAGYPKWSWDKPAASSKAVPTGGNRLVNGHVTLPYVQGVTESLAHILRTADIMVHMRPHKKIHALLVTPKDPTDKMEHVVVIYVVKCGDCDSGYVGETSRPLKKRIMEHHRDSSPVYQHVNDSGHLVNYSHPYKPRWPQPRHRPVQPPDSVPHTPPLWNSMFVMLCHFRVMWFPTSSIISVIKLTGWSMKAYVSDIFLCKETV